MTDLDIANMLAAYHKECDETEGNGHKGLVQLKHARLIREAMNSKKGTARQKFKKGQKVKVVSKEHGHNFYIGEIVTVFEFNKRSDEGSDDYYCTNGCESWFLMEEEIEGEDYCEWCKGKCLKKHLNFDEDLEE